MAMYIKIRGEDYERAVNLSKNRWSNIKDRGKPYAEGIINKNKDPFKAERVGILGEIAFEKITNLTLNEEYIEGGDNGIDFIYRDKKIDVKTSYQISPYKEMLITATDRYDNFLPLKSDYYVCAYMDFEEKNLCIAQITFIGYIEKNKISKIPIKSRVKGMAHKNYVVKYEQMDPINKLLEAISI